MNLPLLMSLAGIAGSFANGIWACVQADLFPTRVRFSGSAFTTNARLALFSSTAPLLATLLIERTGRIDAPVFYIMPCCAVALVASFWLPAYSGCIRHKRVETEAVGVTRIA